MAVQSYLWDNPSSIVPIKQYGGDTRSMTTTGYSGGTMFGAGGTSSGTGSGSYLNDLMAQMEAKTAEANAANEARYAAIRGGENDVDASIGGWRGLRDRSMGYIDALSNQQVADAQMNTQNRLGETDQRMTSSGLYGTTVRDTMRAGVERRGDAEVRRIQDAANQQRLMTDASTSGNLLGFMERREDVAPDYWKYAQMMQNYGSSRPWSMGSSGPTRRSSRSGNSAGVFQTLPGGMGTTGYADPYADPNNEAQMRWALGQGGGQTIGGGGSTNQLFGGYFDNAGLGGATAGFSGVSIGGNNPGYGNNSWVDDSYGLSSGNLWD